MSSPSRPDRNKRILGSVFLLIAVLVSVDIAGDFKSSGLNGHIALEMIIGLVSAAAFFWLMYSREAVQDALEETKGLLQQSQNQSAAWMQEAVRWKKGSQAFIEGLSKSIDQQFNEWHFSPAEKDVALLLIKGLSLKEIAEVRHTSEKTIRVQSLAVYAKASLKGRSELAAFFLEDLLAPQNA